MEQVFIHLHPTSTKNIDRVAAVVKRVNGRILLSFPPSVVVAAMPLEQLGKLSSMAEVQAVYTEEISEAEIMSQPEDVRNAGLVWNKLINKARERQHTSRDLPWDTEGRLPPDLPPELKKK